MTDEEWRSIVARAEAGLREQNGDHPILRPLPAPSGPMAMCAACCAIEVPIFGVPLCAQCELSLRPGALE